MNRGENHTKNARSTGAWCASRSRFSCFAAPKCVFGDASKWMALRSRIHVKMRQHFVDGFTCIVLVWTYEAARLSKWNDCLFTVRLFWCVSISVDRAAVTHANDIKLLASMEQCWCFVFVLVGFVCGFCKRDMSHGHKEHYITFVFQLLAACCFPCNSAESVVRNRNKQKNNLF